MPEVTDALELGAVFKEFDGRLGGQCQRRSGRLLGHGRRARHDEAAQVLHRVDGQSLLEGLVREGLVPGHLDSLNLGGMSANKKKEIKY